ncbi:type VI secretion system secreted protein Hcp [Paraburkholderia atlantica]|uniref:Type VI secretion system secreted protein Hcp n=1 Tax=Paraburkholderia atlantica TaxID=2654982 RepID=A0A6I1Q4W5_PARAM|nr:type VI secretion system tube protein Hcp [Paraburkholderia atlantica]MBB5417383.1 type VI secretion system secreted protein Hcp [Paraburkholderia atlantica]MBB5425995.1 type VI secretion system secreted protein Hcp [Paraburkholderia atlantica]MPW06690.1 Hcp1 family type VI secretion system effector [Paraburkholderia atlantica]NUY32361.1 type VI secretion system tube protein Hcp [Paraburkholderia atlantica]
MDTVLLQIKDIKGNSTLEGATEHIVLYSYSLGVTMQMNNDVGRTERTLGRPNFMEFNVNKATDQSTPALYAACAGGTKLGEAKISIGRNENSKFMPLIEYTLSDAMISAITTSGSGESQDNVTINFSKITTTYTQQNVDSTKKGTASFGWDLAANKPITVSAS